MVRRKANEIAIIDVATRKIVKTEFLGDRPDMLAISSDGSKLFVTIRNGNKLLVLSADDLGTIAEVETGTEPHGVAYRGS